MKMSDYSGVDMGYKNHVLVDAALLSRTRRTMTNFIIYVPVDWPMMVESLSGCHMSCRLRFVKVAWQCSFQVSFAVER